MDAAWHRDAVIYGVDVSRFADSNGDGFGDFPGLTGKVRYLADLGVTCIWLLPFYPSPGRDNGYDVREYLAVDPRCGTLDDFLAFRHAAAEQGIRVLVDLVGNHTSDTHPWFQAARHDEKSRYRDYYVWSKHPPPVPEGESNVFQGEIDRVWTYDEVARAYYFHRFYPFEPGLNGANPAVHEEIRRIMDFWLSLGVDGFRFDAASHFIEPKLVPYATPVDGHAVLRGLYAYMKERRPEAILLAEADVPPERIGAYFAAHGSAGGVTGEQVNLLFNFEMDNWLMYAFARQLAEPVGHGMRLVPRPPVQGGWANFLRNLDELDLERLPADAREEVIRTFGPDPSMRIFGRGLRRRLAPMLGGDARRIACAMSLLFSLPGTPTIVYGDEIGMGEDLSQDGRSAVRAPMPWNAGRNGGFSEAPPDRLVQPMVEGPLGFRNVNVQVQRADPNSLWHFVAKLAHLRRRHRSIGQFLCRPVETGHDAVVGLAHDTGHGLLVMFHNLSGGPAIAKPALSLTAEVEAQDLLNGGTLALAPERELPMQPWEARWLELSWL